MSTEKDASRLPHEKGFHISWDQIHRDSRALAWRLDGLGPDKGAWRAAARPSNWCANFTPTPISRPSMPSPKASRRLILSSLASAKTHGFSSHGTWPCNTSNPIAARTEACGLSPIHLPVSVYCQAYVEPVPTCSRISSLVAEACYLPQWNSCPFFHREDLPRERFRRYFLCSSQVFCPSYHPLSGCRHPRRLNYNGNRNEARSCQKQDQNLAKPPHFRAPPPHSSLR